MIKKKGKVLRTTLVLVAVAGLLIAFGGAWFYSQLRGSLPLLEGQLNLKGLTSEVTVERDNLGIPTIRGANRLDVARALGFLHAQDRFFQMDMSRRSAAGELAELFGEKALALDIAHRLHQFRRRAGDVLRALPEIQRDIIKAYAEGVNAGLIQLRNTPFEYIVLRETPRPWQAEDTLLVTYAMYFVLQGDGANIESMRGLMRDMLPPAMYEFLSPVGTSWDAPLLGEAMVTPAPPSPQIFDLRHQPIADPIPNVKDLLVQTELGAVALGSNNWAVAGSKTAHGGAIVANDMHLGLSVPNTWYRATLVFPDNQGQMPHSMRQVSGVTLPGVPVIVAGSNGDVAWGLTNAYGDFDDRVLIEPLGDDAYLTPAGSQAFQHEVERIAVKGRPAYQMSIESTRWGPVIDRDHQGRKRVLRWVAHDLEGVNLNYMALEKATTLAEALDIANRAGLPAQNFIAADGKGHIGWTIAGPIPRRFGKDGRVPRSWAEGKTGWNGWLNPSEYPRVVDPANGYLWTANNRVVGGQSLKLLGDGGYQVGARATQIKVGLSNLLKKGSADELAMLALQLDDKAEFMARWRDLMLETLTEPVLADYPKRRVLRNVVKNWDGHAAIDSVGYRVVRAFRLLLAEEVFTPILAQCWRQDAAFVYNDRQQREGPLWRLVTERPLHLLNALYRNWDDLFVQVIDRVLDRFPPTRGAISAYTWGAYNTMEIAHPLSLAIPFLGHWLNMPAKPLPGDQFMPRVQTRKFGASQRMVVSPGHETQGIFTMPGGQSGHPLSPHYRDGQEDWTRGERAPFLPGPMVHVLRLIPIE